MQEPKITITHEFLKLIAEIDKFKGKWEVLQNKTPERLHQLRKVATIESIGSSTRIEGAKLTNLQVETLLSHLSSASFKTRDEQEVAGYAETMDWVFQCYEDLPIIENHIRQLHQTLLRHSYKDERHRGDYKKLPNHVVAVDVQGKEIGVVFETTSPFDTPREMQALMQWVNKAMAEHSLHPLSIVDNKDLYYKALRRTQTTRKTDMPDWEPGIGFFLRCLKKQKNNLIDKVKQEKGVDDSALPALSIQVLKLLGQHERLTIAEITALTGANQNTLKVRLRKLVATGHIQRHGKARATWYKANLFVSL